MDMVKPADELNGRREQILKRTFPLYFAFTETVSVATSTTTSGISNSLSLSQSTEQATGSQATASRLSGNFSSFSFPFSLHLLRMIPLDRVIQRAAAVVVAACISHWNVCTHELLLHAT